MDEVMVTVNVKANFKGRVKFRVLEKVNVIHYHRKCQGKCQRSVNVKIYGNVRIQGQSPLMFKSNQSKVSHRVMNKVSAFKVILLISFKVSQGEVKVKLQVIYMDIVKLKVIVGINIIIKGELKSG